MMRGQKRRGSCTVLWQLPHPPALQTTVQHADADVAASSHWSALFYHSLSHLFGISSTLTALYNIIYICDSKYTFIAIIVSCEVVELQP